MQHPASRLLRDDDRVEERHHRAQLGADLLDLLAALGLRNLVKSGGRLVVLVDPALRELAVLMSARMRFISALRLGA
jgi:hypothetical protein